MMDQRSLFLPWQSQWIELKLSTEATLYECESVSTDLLKWVNGRFLDRIPKDLGQGVSMAWCKTHFKNQLILLLDAQRFLPGYSTWLQSKVDQRLSLGESLVLVPTRSSQLLDQLGWGYLIPSTFRMESPGQGGLMSCVDLTRLGLVASSVKAPLSA